MDNSKIEKQLASHSRLLMDIKAMLQAFTPQAEPQSLSLKLKKAGKKQNLLKTLKQINLKK